MVNEILDELYSISVFSNLDLKLGYYEIHMRTKDMLKKTFQTHEGHYNIKVISFGLSHRRKYMLVFFDDILIYNKGLATQ